MLFQKCFLMTVMLGFAAAIDTYYMKDYCGQSIDMILEGIDQGRLVMQGFYQGDCNVTIESWYTADRLMFYFNDFNLNSNQFDCNDAFLTVFDGENPEYSRPLYGLNRRCGLDKPTRTNGFTSTTRYLTFRIFSNSDVIYSDVDIIFTSYHSGYCYSYEYQCSNGRCIDDNINCNGYDSCGDGSDCKLSVVAIVGIVSGSVFVVCVIVAIALVIRNAKRRKITTGQVVNQPYGNPATGFDNPDYQARYGTQYSAPYSTPYTGPTVQK